MAKRGEAAVDDRYECFGAMSLDDIGAHLGSLAVEVEDVKRRYNGPISRHRKNIKGSDSAALAEVFGDLLPMLRNPHVNQELVLGLQTGSDVTTDNPVTAHKLTDLVTDVCTFLARFDNSGVTLVSGSFEG